MILFNGSCIMTLLDISSPELVSVFMFNNVCGMQQRNNFLIAPSKLNYKTKSSAVIFSCWVSVLFLI